LSGPTIRQSLAIIQFQQSAPIASTASLTAALDGMFKMVPGEVKLGQHAVAQHGELANTVRDMVRNCDPRNLRELKGINQYQGFKLFACLLPSGKVAVWVLWVGSEPCREVTAFLSRSISYLRAAIEQGKYLPAQ
jgi:hypothetical protein